MESEGWIKLHRQFLEWEWHDSPETVTLFIHLLLMANHEGKKWHGRVIERGQILTSRDKLAEFTHLTVQQVRTCISKLESTGEITKKSTNKYTIITISNYDRYQVREESHQPTNNQQIPNNQPTNNQQITTNKNDKNIYNNSPSSARTREEDYFSGWRAISSVQRAILGFDNDRIAEFKAERFRAEVEEIAPEIEMPRAQVEAFIRNWTEHSPGSEAIKAEYQPTFDVKLRMESWMEKARPVLTARPAKTRDEALEDDLKYIHNFFHGNESDTTPDRQ